MSALGLGMKLAEKWGLALKEQMQRYGSAVRLLVPMAGVALGLAEVSAGFGGWCKATSEGRKVRSGRSMGSTGYGAGCHKCSSAQI